jgi:hypothetical protein
MTAVVSAARARSRRIIERLVLGDGFVLSLSKAARLMGFSSGSYSTNFPRCILIGWTRTFVLYGPVLIFGTM